MITEDHVRELLRSRVAEPTLVVVEGRARVVPAADLESDAYRGAIEVVSAEDLARRLDSTDPSDQDISAVASGLNTSVAELGG
ncbi:hypothetical protein [Streptomyces sp. NPDC054887]